MVKPKLLWYASNVTTNTTQSSADFKWYKGGKKLGTDGDDKLTIDFFSGFIGSCYNKKCRSGKVNLVCKLLYYF